MSDYEERRKKRHDVKEKKRSRNRSDSRVEEDAKKSRDMSDARIKDDSSRSRRRPEPELEELNKKSRSKPDSRVGEESRKSHARAEEDDNRSRKRSEPDGYELNEKSRSKPYSRVEEESKKSRNKSDARVEEDSKRSRNRSEFGVEELDKRSRNRSDAQDQKENKRSMKRTDHAEDGNIYNRHHEASGGTQSNNSIGEKEPVENEDEIYWKAKRARVEETLTMKTGGAYITPARLKMMQSQITDKTSVAYQRLSWEALKKSINGLINKANISNLVHIVRELFQENIIRGRSVMQAQAASPTFTHVYAAMVAIVNTKFPQIGELILKRLIIQFRKGYRRNDKNLCLSSARFIAHLVNQRVAHEVLSLEVLHILLENPSNDSVELAIGFLKECGQLLTKVSPKGVNAVFERLRTILHEAQIDKRVQYMIEVMFAVRKDGFKDHPAVLEDLDLVDEDDQITHLLALENGDNPEDGLNVFKVDENFTANNEKYSDLKRDILGESSSDDDGDAENHSKSDSGDSDDDSNESGQDEEKKTMIIDSTETNLVALRRTIYLTIQSSLDFEECAHKLVKMQMKPGQEVELCNMILDCCSQQRTFEKFYGLLAQRFCMIDRKYITPFQKLFGEQYEFVHRLETNKLRNIAKLFAHLLHTDAISWEVMQCIHLNEDETTSSSRIFIKILFQELCEFMGLTKLNNRLKDPTLQVYFEGLFPRDNPRNTRFSINFFTSIGLGGLTDELRAHLKSVPKPVLLQNAATQEESSSSDSDSSDSSDDSSSSSSSSSSSEDEKPAPTRLSEFLHKQPANSDRHPKNTSKATQNRLLALANYGVENEEPPPTKKHADAKEKRHHHETNEKVNRHHCETDEKEERRRRETDEKANRHHRETDEKAKHRNEKDVRVRGDKERNREDVRVHGKHKVDKHDEKRSERIRHR